MVKFVYKYFVQKSRKRGVEMSTIKEIAKICGVSIATVSNIINNKGSASEETRAKVLKVIEERNYTPNSVAKNLKTKNTRSIGVIAEDMTVFALPDIIDGITEYCEKEDYQILLVNLRLYKKFEDTYYQKNNHKSIVHKEIRKLLSKQVEGIIYIAAHERLINVIPDNLPIPTVVAYGYTNKPEIPSIVVSDISGAKELIDYVVSCGHQKIGVIAGKKDSLHTQARLEGYQRALFEGNILYDPNLVVFGEWDRESGYDNTDELLKKEVTSIFCMNDFMAGGVYDRLYELGIKVGEDIGVVGFDNREMASYEKPPLTTMGLPLHDLGYRASEVILKLLKKEDLNTQKGVFYEDCELYVRESVNKIQES